MLKNNHIIQEFLFLIHGWSKDGAVVTLEETAVILTVSFLNGTQDGLYQWRMLGRIP